MALTFLLWHAANICWWFIHLYSCRTNQYLYVFVQFCTCRGNLCRARHWVACIRLIALLHVWSYRYLLKASQSTVARNELLWHSMIILIIYIYNYWYCILIPPYSNLRYLSAVGTCRFAKNNVMKWTMWSQGGAKYTCGTNTLEKHPQKCLSHLVS